MSGNGLIPQNVLLVSETKIKNFTDIDGNVTSAVLLPFISVVQQTKLEYLIGGRYYKELLVQVSGNTLTEVNENFLNYFAQPLVLWAAYAEALPSVWGRIKNNGIVNGAEQSISLKEMQWFVQKANERSQFFEARMVEQIIWNSNLYPLCFNYTTNDGMMPHLGKNYFSGVHLTNGRSSGWEIAAGFSRAGIGYFSDPSQWCLYGGC